MLPRLVAESCLHNLSVILSNILNFILLSFYAYGKSQVPVHSKVSSWQEITNNDT